MLQMLAMCLTSFLIHVALRDSLIYVVTVPVVKNKGESICSKNNCIPVDLATIVYKVLEYMLYIRLESYVFKPQPGFKKKRGTDLTI